MHLRAGAGSSTRHSGRWNNRWLKFVFIGGCGLVLLASVFILMASEKTRARLIRVAHRIAGKHSQKVQINSLKTTPLLAATGPLRLNRANPRYFTDGSGKAILLVGDHTWYTLQDSGSSDVPPAFDYGAYLNFLQANHINFFRMFVWEQAKWSEGVTASYYYSPLPYQRTGPGTALDGKLKFDLTKLNQTYFDRLRQRLIDAGNRGIYVSIQLFEGFSVQRKPFMAANNPWPGHPFNKSNNINGIDGDLNGNGEGEETETLATPAVTARQEAFVNKIIDTVNDLDNVLFEICNEAQTNSEAWQEHLIRHIHSYEGGRPKQHPVGMTVEFPNGNNAELFASSADWISPNGDDGQYDNPPATDGSKVVVSDTDHLCYPCGDRQWMWKSFLRGNNPAFMDPYDCTADWSPPGWSGCDPNNPTWVSLRQNLGYALNVANRVNLAAMVPHGELVSTGYSLANPTDSGAEYLIYLPSGRTLNNFLKKVGINGNTDVYLPADGVVSIDLSATPRELSVEWFNPRTGATVNGEPVMGGASRSFTAPFTGDAVLYVYSSRS